jgi:small subunit ribosomal protein S19
MAKRELQIRGHTVEELQKMQEGEFTKLLSSRARRNLKRGLTEQQIKLLEKARKVKATGVPQKKPIKTHCRELIIMPELVGLKFAVYNGKEFTEMEITGEMIGRYLAEFTYCRKPVRHSAPGVGATRSSLFVPVK